MGTGYTRNDTANNIADGNVINAADFDGEFDAIESAFNSSSGHTHDGTSAEGAPIEVVGPTQDVVITASALRPKTDNTVDLGTSSLMYKDGFFDGTVTVHSLVVFDDEGTDATIKLDGNYPDGTANVALGLTALDSLDGSSPGGNNIAIGNAALTALTTGSHNIAIGSSAGDALTTGGKNIAIGFEALSTEDGNGESTAIGYQALKTQNAGASGLNVAVGYLAGTAVSTGVKNTLLGAEAGDAINSGGSNVAVGYNALTATTTSSSNTAVGADALKTNVTGASNVAVGNTALEVATGSNNTAIGKDAGNLITSGAANTIIGQFDGNQGTLETLDIRTSSNHIVLSDGAGEPRIVVENNGRVLVGNTSAIQVGGGQHVFQVGNTDAHNFSALRYSNSSGGSRITLGHTRSASVGTVGTAVADNDTLGQIDFAGDDGSDVVTVGARIKAEVDGTPSSNNMPSALTFSTFEASGSLTERMRITDTGEVGINTATPTSYASNQATLVIEDTGNPAIALSDTGQTRDWFLVALGDGLGIRYADGGGSGTASNVTESAFFKNDGKLGIGTSSPSVLLDLESTAPTIRFTDSDASGTPECEISGAGGDITIRADRDNEKASSIIGFEVDGSERMRIDATGRIGINTTTPSATLHVADEGSTHPAILISGGSGTEGDITVPHDENMQIGHWNETSDTFTSRIHIDTSGNVGLGTASPSYPLHVSSTSSTGAVILLESTSAAAADGPILDLYRNSSTPDDDDDIGIIYFSGENDADEKLQYARIDAFIEDASDGTEDGRVTFQVISGGSNRQFIGLRADTGGANGEVVINESQHDIDFRIESDSATNLFVADASADKIGIGTSTPQYGKLHIADGNSDIDMDANGSGQLHIDGNGYGFGVALNAEGANIYTNSSTRDIIFGVNETEVMRVVDGSVGIGLSAPKTDLDIASSTGAKLTLTSTDTSNSQNQLLGSIAFYNNDSSGTGKNNAALIEGQASGSLGNAANLIFKTVTAASEQADADETARFNSAGDFLVSTTDATLYNNTSGSGMCYRSNDELTIASDSTTPLLILNYTGGATDGSAEILRFATDGATVGRIGADLGGIYVGDSDVALEFDGANDDIRPFNSNTPAVRDNAIDLGDATARFDDVFATNSSIQTSDEREKQQIASLTNAEITAATAISKLFKTYKWNDKVEAKGDAARTHTGVIAQQVEQAMTDAGLTASNYAFWCSDTWWEIQTEIPAVEADGPREARDAYTRIDTYTTQEEAPEGATERNRKGIRYPELLAFIGAATEQRLTSIEARLDALET